MYPAHIKQSFSGKYPYHKIPDKKHSGPSNIPWLYVFDWKCLYIIGDKIIKFCLKFT